MERASTNKTKDLNLVVNDAGARKDKVRHGNCCPDTLLLLLYRTSSLHQSESLLLQYSSGVKRFLRCCLRGTEKK